ncbi:MAG: TetR/AcrR family transcriptional regulator [Myxococcales bacterium]|nr:TetR/AcrR family transcriptional regulator [Myxococcales bacterium]
MAAHVEQRSPEEGQDTRERILAAALDAFSERGFDGATTRDIAQRAGVNLGLIQYYFEGKQNLWRESVARAFAELGQGLEDILGDPELADDDERTRRVLRRFVRFVADKPAFVRIMHDEGKRDGERMRWLVDHHVRAFYETIGGLMKSRRDRGLLPEGTDLLSLHYLLIGALTLLFHQAEECKYMTGVDPSDPAMVEAHTRTLELLLLGPLREENPR